MTSLIRRTLSTDSVVGKLIYGTAAGSKTHDPTTAGDQSTHSKLLARGKYVHELQTHLVKPEALEDYQGLIAENYSKIAGDPENKVNLVGSWNTIIGTLDQAIHIWEYRGYPGFHHTQRRLQASAEFQRFQRQLAPMLRERKNEICLEFAFWLTSPPNEHGKVYELRTYQLKSGRLLDWEMSWKKGLECRKKFCQPVGAWFTQLGDLNTVHHMWAYSDLEERKITREQAWQVDGWPQTVSQTVPLIQRMTTQILEPMKHSPLK